MIKLGMYCIDADSKCFTAFEDTGKVDKNGRQIKIIIGYYMSVTSAVRGVYDYIVRKNVAANDYDMAGFIEMLEVLNDETNNILTEHIKEGDI